MTIPHNMGGKASMGTTTKPRGKKPKSITLKKIEPNISIKSLDQ